jgi:hypothetical protein
MTVCRYSGDCCPACGSYRAIPYAVVVGGYEEYGYQCLACEVMWPVLSYPPRDTSSPASRQASPGT